MVSGSSLIGAWTVSVVVLALVAFTRGGCKATRADRSLVVMAAPIAFALFMLILPWVWSLRGLF